MKWARIGAASRTRRTGLTTLVILVVTVAAAIGIARACDVGVAATVVTALLGGGSLAGIYLAWATYKLAITDGETENLVDQLAASVERQWLLEVQIRRLNEPYPLPVSWVDADPELMDSWQSLEELARTGAGWPAPASSDAWAASQDDLVGAGNELATIMARVPTGRLLILGEPGSGKTMLIIRLVLDLLKARAPGAPVPFLVGLASWDPRTQKLDSWLAAQLVIAHPMLAAAAGTGSRAEALLAAGLIIPILDGLDEIPDVLQGTAVTQINDALMPGQHAVVTCRTEQYVNAVISPAGEGMRLRAAAAIVLDPLTAATISRYLLADANSAAAKTRWAPVIDSLGTQAPVAQALTTPLAVSLARTIYNPRPGERVGALRDPAELCDAELTDRAAVESLLLDGLIPASYRQPGRWSAPQAEQCLTFLASHLEYTVESSDYAWWQLPRAAPIEVRSWPTFIVVSGVISWLLIVIVTMIMSVTAGWLSLLAIGLPAGLRSSIEGAAEAAFVAVLLAAAAQLGVLFVSRSRPTRRSARDEANAHGFNSGTRGNQAPALTRGLPFSLRRLIGALVGSLTVCLLFGVVVNQRSETPHRLAPAFIIGLIVGLALGLAAAFAGVTGNLAETSSPKVTLARDRRAAVVRGLVIGLALGLLGGIMLAAFSQSLTGQQDFATIVFFGLVGAAAGLPFISLGMGQDTEWLPYTLARGWFAMRGQLPWRLMGFLSDAHQRGVLRQAGSFYQFRHIVLQQRLTTRQPQDATHYARGVRRLNWSLIGFSVVFVAAVLCYQLTSPRTQLQLAVGWVIALSAPSAVLTLYLIWLYSRERSRSATSAVDYVRKMRKSVGLLVSFSIIFVAGVVGYQFTSPRTQLQLTVGWIIGFSLTAVVVTLIVIWRYGRGRSKSAPSTIDYARRLRRSIRSLFCCAAIFVLSIIGDHFTSTGTSAQASSGWVTILSITGVLVSLFLIRFYSQKKRKSAPERPLDLVG